VIARIVQGVYKPGDQLPPEDQLAAGLGVSRTTIRSALGNLETLGHIQRIHGAGTFVTQRRFQVEAQLDALESFHPRLAARVGRSSQITHLTIREMQADAETARALGLRAGDPVISISRVVEIDTVPVVYLEDFLPEAIATVAELQANFRDSVVKTSCRKPSRLSPSCRRTSAIRWSITSTDEKDTPSPRGATAIWAQRAPTILWRLCCTLRKAVLCSAWMRASTQRTLRW